MREPVHFSPAPKTQYVVFSHPENFLKTLQEQQPPKHLRPFFPGLSRQQIFEDIRNYFDFSPGHLALFVTVLSICLLSNPSALKKKVEMISIQGKHQINRKIENNNRFNQLQKWTFRWTGSHYSPIITAPLYSTICGIFIL